MDPLSAVSLGANILQFIQFTTRLIGVGQEIHQSIQGATVENLDLESATRTIRTLQRQVLKSSTAKHGGFSSHQMQAADLEMERLAKACDTIASELLDALEKLKCEGRKNSWNTMFQALKAVWGKRQIDALNSRLQNYQGAIQMALLMSLRQKAAEITPDLAQNIRANSGHAKLKTEILQMVQNNVAMNDEASFSRRFSTLTKEEENEAFQKQLLEQLRFLDQYDRECRIAKAHKETFKWIFSSPSLQDGRSWSDFGLWLQQDEERLYWITGKAGSGKSTLMKYIAHQAQCNQLLRTWASSLRLVVTRFYFWNSGGRMQMSQEGLLRSILHDAIRQYPDLTQHILPQRWNRSQIFGSDLRPWIQTELIISFNRLLACASKLSFKLCLFVDGLDEFEGDHEELTFLFKNAAKLPNVKICLSSRPWIVFEEAFGTEPSLKLEQLTYPDIIRFVTVHFNANPGFKALERREPAFASNLIKNIAKKACGVFLWVHLVVKSLLDGLRNYDRVSDLQQRLEELPSDLEAFYRKIFDSIEERYVKHAYQFFRLHDAAAGRLTILGLYFADEESSLSKVLMEAPVNQISWQDTLDRYESTKRRLNSRCKGFLEFDERQDPSSRRSSSAIPLLSSKISYLHRTVKDFFETPYIQAQIRTMTTDYDPYVWLIISSISIMRTYYRYCYSYSDSKLDWELDNICFFMNQTQFSIPWKCCIIEEAYRIAENQIILGLATFREEKMERPLAPHELMKLAARHRHQSLVSDQHQQGIPVSSEDNLLSWVVKEYEILLAPIESERANWKLYAEKLLATGIGPDTAVDGQRAWDLIIQNFVEILQLALKKGWDDYSIRIEQWIVIAQLFLEAGADPQPWRSRINDLYGGLLPSQIRRLEDILDTTLPNQPRRPENILDVTLPNQPRIPENTPFQKKPMERKRRVLKLCLPFTKRKLPFA